MKLFISNQLYQKTKREYNVYFKRNFKNYNFERKS